MNIIRWNVPVIANTNRANDLEELRFTQGSLTLMLIEDETEKKWSLCFKSIQAFRVTSEECASELLRYIPVNGGFFKVIDSPWLQELGKGDIHFMRNVCHYIIFCYDNIVEVVSDVEHPVFETVK